MRRDSGVEGFELRSWREIQEDGSYLASRLYTPLHNPVPVLESRQPLFALGFPYRAEVEDLLSGMATDCPTAT